MIVPCFGSDCITTGEVCHLVKMSTQTDLVLVAISLDAYKEFRKAILANDREGVAQMAEAGKILGAKAGDGLRILDVSVFEGWAEGRLTSGEHARRHVWATRNWVK
jgi:hypothetical protein